MPIISISSLSSTPFCKEGEVFQTQNLNYQEAEGLGNI